MSFCNKNAKDYISKKDVQQDKFLKNNPEYDGRGVLIAIIDSAVDVSLPGMQKTSTGLPKVIDCYDFTQNGNVDTSTIKRSRKSDNLTLLSGRKIIIPKSWKNPSNKWHLGVKPLYEVCPPELDKAKNQKKMEEELFQDDKFDIIKLQKRGIANKIYPEKISENNYIDCIVWNNGEKWQACIIFADSGNLENAKILTNFRDEREYCFIMDKLSCCVTIEKGGNLLQLFIPYDSHGSSVAQIAAAHFPGEPEKDGLAPGAQIISINVMDKIFNSKITVVALEKAISKCIELSVDIVNFSFLSFAFNENVIIKLLKEMINIHGIIVTKSAGNFGPLFSSINNSIVDVHDEILTVGSIFTCNTRSLFVEDEKDFPPIISFYSAKGPLSNGACGVTVAAPSFAITENPRWHPSEKGLFYGTSSSAPNVAGSIACLLSALKANSIKYTPFSVKMALSNTAFLPEGGDRLGFGNGIIQINSAFEYLNENKENLQNIAQTQICIKESNEKGIVIYQIENITNIYEYCISIKNLNNQTNKKIRWILKLTEHENSKHIEYSKVCGNNLFNVKIDTKTLQSNNIYYSEIHGFDIANQSMGPLFRLPITVVVPEKVINNIFKKEIFVKPPSVLNFILYPDSMSKKCVVQFIDEESGKIKYQIVIEKEKHVINGRLPLCPEGTNIPWCGSIQWKKVFEICICQMSSIYHNYDLKCVLKIIFEI